MPREMVSIRSIKMKKMNQSVANAITAVLNFTEIKVEELKNMPSSLLRDDFCHEVPEGVRLLGQSIEEGCKDADRSLRSFVSMTKKIEFTSILKISKWQRKNMENALEECELLMNLLEVEPTASLKNIDCLRTTVSNTKEDLQCFCQSRRNMFAELISRTRKVIDEQKKRENYFKTRELSNIEIENKEIEKEDPMVSPTNHQAKKKKFNSKLHMAIRHNPASLHPSSMLCPSNLTPSGTSWQKSSRRRLDGMFFSSSTLISVKLRTAVIAFATDCKCSNF